MYILLKYFCVISCGLKVPITADYTRCHYMLPRAPETTLKHAALLPHPKFSVYQSVKRSLIKRNVFGDMHHVSVLSTDTVNEPTIAPYQFSLYVGSKYSKYAKYVIIPRREPPQTPWRAVSSFAQLENSLDL